MLSARELHDRGVRALEHGRLAEAARALHTALERTDDPELRARVLLSLAYHEAERGRVDDGLALLDSADDGRAALPGHLRALLASQRGLLLMRGGDSEGALHAFTVALDGLGDDPAPVARACINRGNVFMQRLDLRRAAGDFARCVDVATRNDLPVLVAKARHNLGYVELLAGNLPAALREMAAASEELARTAPALVPVCDTDRAQALMTAGLPSEADRTLAEAAASFGRQRLRQSQGEVDLLRAQLALASGRPGDAVRTGRRAAARFRRRGSRSWALRADAVVLAGLVDCGRQASALRTGPELADALDGERLRDEARTVRLHVVRGLLQARHADQAHAAVHAVRTPASAPITTRLLDRGVRADVATARGRRADAAGHLRRGLAELFAWQSSFGSLDLQTGVAAHGRALAVRALQAAVADGRPEVVFDWSERARAFASRVPSVRAPADSAAAVALEELRALRAESAGDPDAATRRRMGELERQVRDRALYPPGPGIVTEPLGLDDVRARVAVDDATLVSHLVVDDQLHALVVTGNDVTVHRLGAFPPVASLVTRIGVDLDTAATRLPPAIRDRRRHGPAGRVRRARPRAGRPAPARRRPGPAGALGGAGRGAVDDAARARGQAAGPGTYGDLVGTHPPARRGRVDRRAGRRPRGRPRRGGGGPGGEGLAPAGRVDRRAVRVPGDRLGGHRAGLAGRPAARGRARHAQCRQPAVLRAGADRRAVVRPRHRRRRPGACPRGALCLRARPVVGARG